MASSKLEKLNLSALDYDDDSLIRAFNKKMSFKKKDLDEEFAKERTKNEKNSKKGKWSVGDFCCAVYPDDNLPYEAKIVEISGDSCTVDFIGFNELTEVDLKTLSDSKGRNARKKQIKNVRKGFPCSEDESATSIDDSRYYRRNAQRTKLHPQRKVNHGIDHSANYAAKTFQNCTYSAPTPNYSVMPPPPLMMPPTSMLSGLDVSQDTSMSSMLSSLYMAGYYTGYHQAQSNRSNQCCCRNGPNYCH